MNLKFWTWFSSPEPTLPPAYPLEGEIIIMNDPLEYTPLAATYDAPKPRAMSEAERDRVNIPAQKFDEVRDV